MAYNSKTDRYSCDTCGFENKWDDTDDENGELWGCEKCGNTFCSKCFIDRYGRQEYMDMMQNSSHVYCPDCLEKQREQECL